ncbi:FtsX-like permease family protein [Christensenellaceae bacterium NSJ-44]|uniref:FtsX-like permease family protein n=1 Tax=Luoshenia tenuis TaxID=2763654 RepID=A0A926CXW0_9FIRM|nr:FtsX-like permease family protein [Luoshenia tenuis]MBC8527992.1 FtsX-like permease family protein [Luoshenia tenuis]
MAKGFFAKMAWSNLKRNRSSYMPYLIATVITVAIYFIIVTMMDTPGLRNVPGGPTLQTMFMIGETVLVVFCVIFMVYLNSFLIKRRKKEFGLYAILGLEKRHVGRMMLWESLMLNGGAIVIGTVAGLIFGKLIFMMLMGLLNVSPDSEFIVPAEAFIKTGALFLVIFVFTSLYNLFKVRLANPIDLLTGEQQGEKRFRTAIPLAIIGAALLGWAYYTALSVRNASDAFIGFMFAVIAVILATYMLFTAGSYLLLRILRRNKRLYYKPNNFVAISGMMHRMRQNAAGLASICILSTMVLVTITTSVSLYAGQEQMLKVLYPNDLTLSMNEEVYAQRIDTLKEQIRETAAQNGVTIESMYATHTLNMTRRLEGDQLTQPGTIDYTDPSRMDVAFLTAGQYNELTGDQLELEAQETVVITNAPLGGVQSLTINGHTLQIAQAVCDSPLVDGKNSEEKNALYLVVRDWETAQEISGYKEDNDDSPSWENCTMVVNYTGEQDQMNAFAAAVDGLRKLDGDVIYHVNDINTNRLDIYGVSGGLLFIGAFFTILFLMATVLIIYFKQISEGFEDKARFEILQKVGMDDRAVKRSINKQILLVFFLPLVGALLHTGMAANMIIKMLEMFSLYDVGLTLGCMGIACVAFSLVYVLVYQLTAKVYYRTVKW